MIIDQTADRIREPQRKETVQKNLRETKEGIWYLQEHRGYYRHEEEWREKRRNGEKVTDE